jgi:hypothetical protein
VPKVFNLSEESYISSYFFDTTVEGALSKIMFVNIIPFFMYYAYGYVSGRCMLIQNVTITVTKDQSEVLLEK